MKKLISILLFAAMLQCAVPQKNAFAEGELSEGQMEMESEQFEEEMKDQTAPEDESGDDKQTEKTPENSKTEFSEKDEKYIKLLKRLNIADWDELSFSDMQAPVTRGDAVITLIKLFGFSEETKTEDGVIKTTLTYPDLFPEAKAQAEKIQNTVIFDDLPEGHKAAQAVRAAYVMGLVRGSDDGLFHPDDAVNYEQLAKMMTYVIGFENAAKVKGGYPNGYVRVMYDKKVFSNSIKSLSGNVTRLSFAKLLYELLDVEILSVKTISENKVEFAPTAGETVLSSYMGIDKTEGIVNGNRFSSYGGGKCSDNMVCVNSQIYKDLYFDGDGMLGCAVECYTKDDTALALIPDYKDRVYIDATDVTEVKNVQRAGAYVKHNKNKGMQTLTVSAAAAYIKNNTYLSVATDADFVFDDGYIALTDNDGDGVYDVLNAAAYDIYVTEAASAESERVFDKYQKTLDLKDRDYIIRTPGGGSVKMSEIKEYDCLSVITPRSASGRYEIILTDSVKEGTVTAKDGENIYIDEIAYKTASMVSADSVSVGKKATYVTDAAGRIAYISIKEGLSGTYGYVLKAVLDIKGVKKRIGLRVAQPEKKSVAVYSKGELKINGKRMSAENAIALLSDRMLIKYTLTEDGTLDEIFLPKINDDRGVDTEHFSRDCVLTKAYNNYNYRYGELYNMTADTLVILTVEDGFTESDPTDSKNCLVTDRSSLSYNTAKYENVEIYDADENYSIGVAVIKHSGSFTSGSTSATMGTYRANLVTAVRYALDTNEGQMRKQIEYVSMTGSVNKSFISDNLSTDTTWCGSKTFDDVRPGDIIAVNTNAAGEIYQVAFLLDSDSIYNGTPAYFTRSSDESGGEARVHGEMFMTLRPVIEKSGNTVLFEAPDPAQPSGFKRIGATMNANVLIFDTSEKSWRRATAKDVFRGDDVFIHISWQWFQGLVVYR